MQGAGNVPEASAPIKQRKDTERGPRTEDLSSLVAPPEGDSTEDSIVAPSASSPRSTAVCCLHVWLSIFSRSPVKSLGEQHWRGIVVRDMLLEICYCRFQTAL